VLKVVIIVLEGATGIVGRIYENAFHASGIVRQQGFEGLEVVSLDEEVVLCGFKVADYAAFNVSANFTPS